MKQKTNFDRYLEEQLKDPAFVKCCQNAGAVIPHARVYEGTAR